MDLLKTERAVLLGWETNFEYIDFFVLCDIIKISHNILRIMLWHIYVYL